MSKAVVYRDEPYAEPAEVRHVLVTGAAGTVGRTFAAHAQELYRLRLMVRGDEPGIDALEGLGEIVKGDLTDPSRLAELAEGIDTVVHLAADPRIYAEWDSLLPNNIIGAYNLFEAAKQAGCRRVIFASSVNAMNGAPKDTQIRADDPISPGNLYGVSKCFGEALCRLYAVREGMSCIALRIGAFQTLEAMHGHNRHIPRSVFVSPRDLMPTLTLCVEDRRVQFGIFHALSANQYNHFDISETREVLGYQPQDDAFAPPIQTDEPAKL